MNEVDQLFTNSLRQLKNSFEQQSNALRKEQDALSQRLDGMTVQQQNANALLQKLAVTLALLSKRQGK